MVEDVHDQTLVLGTRPSKIAERGFGQEAGAEVCNSAGMRCTSNWHYNYILMCVNWKCLPFLNCVWLLIALLCFRQSASSLISRYS